MDVMSGADHHMENPMHTIIPMTTTAAAETDLCHMAPLGVVLTLAPEVEGGI